MMCSRAALPIVLSVTFASACATTAPSAPPPEVELLTMDAKSSNPTLSNLDVALPWELHNPTSLPATVDAIDWTLEVDERDPLTGSVRPNLTVAPTGREQNDFTVSIPLVTDETATSVSNRVISYRITAIFKIKSGKGIDEFEALWHGELLAPQPPRVNVSAGGARYDARAYELNFDINIENPNSFSLKLSDFSYKLFIEGTEVSQGVLVRNRSLGPATVLQFQIDKMVNKANFNELLQKILIQKNIAYRFEGNLQLQDRAIALPIAGEVNFDH